MDNENMRWIADNGILLTNYYASKFPSHVNPWVFALTA